MFVERPPRPLLLELPGLVRLFLVQDLLAELPVLAHLSPLLVETAVLMLRVRGLEEPVEA